MPARVTAKGSVHFIYVHAFPYDENKSIREYKDMMVAVTREHYDKIFPHDKATVVIEEPLLVKRPTDLCIMEVDVGVFEN